MTALARLSLGLGVGVLILHGLIALVPGMARKVLTAFPRNRTCAWLLSASALVWAGVLLSHAPLGRFEPFKPLLYVLVPLAIVLVGLFVDELLAPRALGGLLILAAAPMLDIARWHLSPWRRVIVVLAYLIVIKGVVLVVSPYRFRKVVERYFASDGSCRAWAGLGCALGAGLILLALFVY